LRAPSVGLSVTPKSYAMFLVDSSNFAHPGFARPTNFAHPGFARPTNFASIAPRVRYAPGPGSDICTGAAMTSSI
jgi:hypothetical protein